MSNVILLPTMYCPNPDTSQALGDGYVYIGQPNTDPTVEANRISVTLTEQDGSTVVINAASQPLTLGSGGVIIYNNSPISQATVSEAYSMTIEDSNNVEKYYFPNAGLPDLVTDIQDGVYTYLTNVAGTNVVTAEADPTLTAYAVTQVFRLVPANSNTGAVTLNIDGIGAGAVTWNGNALTGGEFKQNVPVMVQVTSATPTYSIMSSSFNTVARNLLQQSTTSNMLQTGLGVSSVGGTLITQTTQALMRSTGLGFSADTYLGGAWTTPTFSAGNFTGNGSMTWTVASGDVTTYAYIINGKMMTVSFWIVTSTVGGTPNTNLLIAIPASKVATKNMMSNNCRVYNNSTYNSGACYVESSGTTIIINTTPPANFTAESDTTEVIGQITFEIN